MPKTADRLLKVFLRVAFGCLLFFLPEYDLNAQPYKKGGKTRHRFAQLTLGVDVLSSIGGKSVYLNAFDQRSSFRYGSFARPRILVGGTHFWGHAEFFIAIPLLQPEGTKEGQEFRFTTGVETVFKFFPYTLEKNKIRPFLGFSLTPYNFEQRNKSQSPGNGGIGLYNRVPFLAGLSYLKEQHLFEATLTLNYANSFDYYVSQLQRETFQLPPVYLGISYKYMLDTTLGAEKDWESGRTEEITFQMEEKGLLNGVYIGAGLSSGWALSKSEYNKALRPFIPFPDNTVFPDATLGYYLHEYDVNIGLSYRGYDAEQASYGVRQRSVRKSIALEGTKYVWDYHGFAPFIGPSISLEWLSFQESIQNVPIEEVSKRQVGYGVLLGWDIRPNRIQSMILRTNLRWYPALNLSLTNRQSVSFSTLEFNFIQLIIFPNRMF